MRKILLSVLLVIFATVGLSFIGVEAVNLQDQVYELYGRFDASILTVMYPVGIYDYSTQEFTMNPDFDVNNLLFGLNLKLPLEMLYIRGAAYTTVSGVMNYPDTGIIPIYGRFGAGFNLLFLNAEAGVRLFYNFGDPQFTFNFDPQQIYFALGLSF
ncbi:hypothetical protein [Fervidobacterium sp.]